jgi:hypothetical protein
LRRVSYWQAAPTSSLMTMLSAYGIVRVG